MLLLAMAKEHDIEQLRGKFMVWDSDFDVKEYRPKKKTKGSDIAPIPDVGEVMANAFLPSSLLDRSGGVTMSTSEILDFAEGSDSYV